MFWASWIWKWLIDYSFPRNAKDERFTSKILPDLYNRKSHAQKSDLKARNGDLSSSFREAISWTLSLLIEEGPCYIAQVCTENICRPFSKVTACQRKRNTFQGFLDICAELTLFPRHQGSKAPSWSTSQSLSNQWSVIPGVLPYVILAVGPVGPWMTLWLHPQFLKM